jgi:ATP-dependent Lhr-like helicase
MFQGRDRERLEATRSDDARRVLAVLRSHGASFFSELLSSAGLRADDLRHAIGALVAAGLAVSDGFSGVRALVWAARGRPATRDRRTSFAGRWSVIGSPSGSTTPEDALDIQARALLRRYGVVFRRLLTREAAAAPWRDLTRVLRRLEARGEIRGGRFVGGMSGEQFALPEAVEALRKTRRTQADGRIHVLSTSDPLNLAGIVTAGERVRSVGRNRIAYRDGVPLAAVEGDVVRELAPIDPATASELARVLGRRRRATSAA